MAESETPSRKTPATVAVRLRVNGTDHQLEVEPRATLLDTLRERLGLTGTKKGCDRGECGACTVHAGGRRINACMTLAVMHDGGEITTIEGIEGVRGEAGPGSSRSIEVPLHPVQVAFIEHDAFQCGYCTPGQVMSAIACIAEGHAASAEEIREWMSGNLCRCGAYAGIVAAVAGAAAAGRR